MDGALGNSGLLGDGLYTLVCCDLWFTSECLGDQFSYRLIVRVCRCASCRMGANAKPHRCDGIVGLGSYASTIFARNVSATANERNRVMEKRCARSTLDIVSVVFGRPVRIGQILRSGYPKSMQ